RAWTPNPGPTPPATPFSRSPLSLAPFRRRLACVKLRPSTSGTFTRGRPVDTVSWISWSLIGVPAAGLGATTRPAGTVRLARWLTVERRRGGARGAWGGPGG